MNEKKNDSMNEDKYKGKAIRFIDKDDHYELIFTDDFNIPSSGNFDDKPDTLITDIITDMREANKNKELHIFVGSFGGYVVCLNMLLQQVLEFEFRVGINLGMACSCGFMLLASCHEIYTSEFSKWMYHSMSGLTFGKVQEQKNISQFNGKWWDILTDITCAHRFLTPEECKLGETSEVWLTGEDIIERGFAMPYRYYKHRKGIVPANNEFFTINDEVYRRNGRVFNKYSQDKPCKKNNQNSYTYIDLLRHVNKDIYA
jgi:ATP-dependent protease ClpP protease subunit